MVADSRQVALNHTAGLSLPQQTQMSLFASFALLDAENTYKKRMQDMIHERLHTLWESTGFTLLDDPLRAGYYSEIDMLVWAKKFYGDDFVEYLKELRTSGCRFPSGTGNFLGFTERRRF